VNNIQVSVHNVFNITFIHALIYSKQSQNKEYAFAVLNVL